MRVSVVLPDDLSRQLEEVRQREQRPLSGIVRDAVADYLNTRQRREAGERLKRVIAKKPLTREQARAALDQLHRERKHSDRI